MKSQITSMLMSLSFLVASVAVTGAQEFQTSPNTVVVESGNDLRCRLEKGLRITKPGEPITARLIEPVYAGTTLAIPEGSTINGHISSISTAVLKKRAGRLLRGDFTPPRTAKVTFDRLILPDGTALQVHTDTTVGIGDMQTAQYLPKSQRPGVRQKLKDAAKPMREPNKLQRLRQAAITSLPYHPEYLDQGTIFDASLLDPIRTPAPVQPAESHSLLGDHYLHLRLLTPLKSEMIARGAAIEAAVSRPYYNSDHVLLYAPGTKLEGTVTKAVAAGWMKTNGQLLFSFRSAQTPDGITTDVIATVAGIEAAGSQRLAVGLEGSVNATTSLFSRLRAPMSLIGPSRAAADLSLDKTAWSRAGEGRTGFGFFGAGAAQASAATAIGFGYFGAAVKIYDAFFAKGSNVELPINTPLILRIEKARSLSNVSDPQVVVRSASVGKP